MLDKLGNEINGVCINKPNHTHLNATLACMERGIHVCTRKPPRSNPRGLKNGASEEVRTLDIHLGKVVLYQLSYARLLKEAARI